MKYLGHKTKAELMAAVKRATSNEKFFDRSTMRFFGKQKFSIEKWDNKAFLLFKVTFLEKCPRVSYYRIEPETLKLNSFNERDEHA